MNRRPPQPRDRTQAARLERRSKNRRKPDYLALCRNLLLVALIGQGLRVAFASPRLRLNEVQVRGTARLSPADVARHGQIPLGQNIFRVNLIKVSDRLLQDPIIRDAVVTRDLPNSLSVEIRERVPAYQVASEGVRWDVDREGVVFQRAKNYFQGRPLLELQPADLPKPGQKLRGDVEKAYWDCIKLAKKESLDLRHLRVDGTGELWISLATGAAAPAVTEEQSTRTSRDRSEDAPSGVVPGRLKVRMGRIAELPAKFRDIRQLIQGRPSLMATAAHLNVMCAGRPAYMLASKNGDPSPSP